MQQCALLLGCSEGDAKNIQSFGVGCVYESGIFIIFPFLRRRGKKKKSKGKSLGFIDLNDRCV